MTDDLQKFLDELRSRISIAEVVGNKVKLTKRGREYLGLCPFHNEKTPSFTVNESKGFYHCFGCGAHGDIIKFEMEANGLPFIEAVKKLAAKCGLNLPEFSRESQERNLRRKSLYEIMELACTYFEKNLRMPEGAAGLTYFQKKRELSAETIKKFRLGYAPNNNGLKAYLADKGISENEMSELGLITVPEDKNRQIHDFFRNRVMIPIINKQGNIIAFGGRIMDNSQPKYLNSPETPIFNKRRTLYNMNYAKDAAYSQKRLIICEGYMDVIALDSFGFNYAVAPLGTALTEEQILEAWKVCATPTLCFDGDGAGIKAAIRSVDRILPILKPGFSANYIFLKEKKDPDELLHSLGAAAFEQYLQKSHPLVDILWHKCKMDKDAQTPEQKALIEKETYEEVAKIANVQIRSYYMQEMKKRIYYTFGKGSIYNEQRDDERKNKTVVKAWRAASATGRHFVKKPPLADLDLRRIVAAMILYPELIEKYAEKLTVFDTGTGKTAKMLAEIIEIESEEEHLDSERLLEKLNLNFAKEINELWELNMYRSQRTNLPEIKNEINNCLTEIQLKQLDTEIKKYLTLINDNQEHSEKYYSRYQQLVKEKNALIADKE